MTTDRIIGVICMTLGLAMLAGGLQIQQNFPGSGDPGPQLVPMILAGLLVLLGVSLALRRPASPVLSETAQTTAEATEADPEEASAPQLGSLEPPSMPRRIGIGLAFMGFLALFTPLGFSLSATLFLAIAMILMDAPTLPRILARSAVALVVVTLLGLIMTHLLDLAVPGVWFA
ncbi:tripartite tricarboxylate transporter TctB family protein [Ferrimonas balearica]|nr:tripartite tricarboxylate transporter TctB family protein [Ferrimonas balearica]